MNDQSLKANLLASFTSQIYVSLVGIAILPVYIKYMGAEAYGLVGFFAMLQVCFNLLDLGLTPTISRETARFRGQAINALVYRRLLRALSSIFLLIAFLGGGALLLMSGYIAKDWLNVRTLPLAEVQFSIQNMAICAALRWMCGLYRGVLSGSERLVWVGSFNIIITTLRFVLVLPVMWHFGATPRVFFLYQTSIGFLEILGFWLKARNIIPGISETQTIGWSLQPLKPVFKFSLTIAFTSVVWIITTQADKLFLSKILMLNDYGYFSLAVLVASGIILISSPISTVIMPRMAKLEAEGDYCAVIQTYRRTTKLVAVIAGSASITLVFCAKPLLWAWMGDSQLVEQTAPILSLYAAGNGIFALAAFPYYLQYAKGDLRLHFIGHLLLLFLFIPLMIWLATYHGALGAGYAWILINSLYFIIWVAVVHKRFEPGLHLKWLGDIFIVLLVLLTIGFIYSIIQVPIESRVVSLVSVLLFGLIAFCLSGLTVQAGLQKKFRQGILNTNE